jgi:predicted small lipoprotein YifL
MKNKLLAIILVTTAVISLASCATGRKGYGCPTTVKSSISTTQESKV